MNPMHSENQIQPRRSHQAGRTESTRAATTGHHT